LYGQVKLFRMSWLPPRDSNPDMLIQSQLSCDLPLLLICPDYAICGCIIKVIREAVTYRVNPE
jgi:hypothetical protein